MNTEFLFDENLKMAHLPVDLNTAAVTGARIKMDKCERIAVVCQMGDSVGATVAFTLKQHNAAAAGTSKALSVANNYFVKVGAATSFTKVEPTVEASVYDLSADFAAQEGVVVFEVLPDQLDTNNGFAWFSIDIADSVAAKLASTVYIVEDSSYCPAYAEVI